jgi:hypothetical protein
MMPKPMKTRLRGAASAATLFALGMFFSCCGCPFLPRKVEPPKPVNIVIHEAGNITVDGTPATYPEPLAEMLKQKAQARQKALQAVPPPAVPLPPAQRPREVLINVASPEKSTYEDLCRVLLACGAARLTDLDIEGIPMSLPTELPISADNESPQAPLWLPLDIAGPADLPKLQAHAADLNGRGVLLRARLGTPVALVLDVLRIVHASGGTFGFIVPYNIVPYDGEVAESGETHVTLEAGVLCANGVVGTRMKIQPEKRSHVDARRKKSKPAPFSIVRQFTQNPSPETPAGQPNPKAVPTVGADSPGFFGIPLGDPPRKIVFILDRSGSMTDIIDLVKYLTKRCLGELAESDQFDVLFFASGPPPEGPSRALVAATERNKQLAFEFIDGVIAEGETDPVTALQRAFAAKPKVIVVLTDGEFDPQVARLVKDLNKDGKVKVHTIGFLYKIGEAILKQIAAENGGVYKFVSEADLADMCP